MADETFAVRDAAILRAHYGPAAVPDPAADDEYTWTEESVPLEVIEKCPTPGPELLHQELDLHKAAIRKLQADVRHLSALVHRLMNVGEEPDAE
jgi:hypothetical protein